MAVSYLTMSSAFPDNKGSGGGGVVKMKYSKYYSILITFFKLSFMFNIQIAQIIIQSQPGYSAKCCFITDQIQVGLSVLMGLWWPLLEQNTITSLHSNQLLLNMSIQYVHTVLPFLLKILKLWQKHMTKALFLYSLSGAGSGGKHQTVTIPSGCIWGCSADEQTSQQWTLYGYSFWQECY